MGKPKAKILYMEIERVRIAAEKLLDTLLEDMESGLTKYRPLHTYFLNAYIIVLTAVTLALVWLSWTIWSPTSNSETCVCAEDVMSSIHAIAIYFEVILGALIFVLEFASEYIRTEYLLDAPSVIWLAWASRFERVNMRHFSKLGLIKRLLARDRYVSTSIALLLSIFSILSFLETILLINILNIEVKSIFIIITGIIISIPLILNILWLFNSPSIAFYSTIKMHYYEELFKRKIINNKIILFILMVFLLIFPLLLLIFIQNRSIFRTISIILSSAAILLSVYVSSHFVSKGYNSKYISIFIVLFILIIIFIPFLINLANGIALNTMGDSHAVAAKVFLTLLLALQIYMLASMSGAVRIVTYPGRRLVAMYFKTYANYLVDELATTRTRNEKFEELLAELVFLEYLQLAGETVIDCLSEMGYSYEGEGSNPVRRILITDKNLLRMVKNLSSRVIWGDLLGSSFISLTGILATLRFETLTILATERECVQRNTEMPHNVDKLAEVMVRSYGLATIAEDTVESFWIMEILRLVKSATFKNIVPAARMLDIMFLRDLSRNPLFVLVPSRSLQYRIIPTKLEMTKILLKTIYESVARAASRNIGVINKLLEHEK